MEPLYPLLEALLELFIVVFGFSLILKGANIIKTSPGRILGNMAHATIKGVWWLVKGTVWLLGVFIREAVELVSAVAFPSPKTTRANVVHNDAFLTGFARRKLIRRWGNDGVVVDGRRRMPWGLSTRGVAVIAPTGAGKTTTYLIVNALSGFSGSAVITDPSGEIYKASAGYLSRSHEIKVFNVSDVATSHFFNPLHRADNHTAIGQLADTVIRSAFPQSRDQFWNASAKSLLSVLIRAIKTQPSEYANLHNLRFLLNNFGRDGSNLNRFVSSSLDRSSFEEWKGIVANEPKVLASILSTCKAALEKVADPNVARLTASETLHFEDLRGPRPTVMYIIVPESEVRYWSFLTNLLIGQLFSYCAKPPRPGEPYQPILFLLDEFANLGRFPDFSVTASIIRKYSCSLSIVLQDVLQLESVYGSKAEASVILNGAMTTKLFLPGLPHQTCEHLSRVCGKGKDGQPVLSPVEIRTLPDSSGLLISGNKLPLLLKMRPYYKSRKLLARSRIPPPPLPVHDISEPLPYLEL